MGVLNVLKGAYLSDGAVDKTLPLTSGQTCVRGSILVIDATSHKFRLCTADDAATNKGMVPYVALVPSDKVAGYAGAVGPQASPNAGSAGALPTGSLGVVRSTSDATLIAGGEPVVTAIPLNMEGEFECSEYAGSPALDNYLTFGADGKLAVGTATGKTIIGKVTAIPAARYQNDKAVTVGGTTWSQGGATSVIKFATFFVPLMS